MDWSRMDNCGNYNQPSIKALKRRKAKRAKKAAKEKIDGIVKEFQSDLIDRMTPAEKAFQEFLSLHQIKHQFQKIIRSRKQHYIVDFYLTQYHTIVEIDGGYHNNPEQKGKDKVRSRNLKENIIVANIIRFTNDDVLRNDFGQVFVKKLFPFIDRMENNEPAKILQMVKV